jgi:hypothetical protein
MLSGLEYPGESEDLTYFATRVVQLLDTGNVIRNETTF